MILISMELLLISLFTAQFEVRAWNTETTCFRKEPCNLSMGCLSCFSTKKSLAENLHEKSTPYILHCFKCK